MVRPLENGRHVFAGEAHMHDIMEDEAVPDLGKMPSCDFRLHSPHAKYEKQSLHSTHEITRLIELILVLRISGLAQSAFARG